MSRSLTRSTTRAAALLAVGVLALTACGGGDAASGGSDPLPTEADGGIGAPPAMGACLEGVPDCVDTVVDPEGGADRAMDPDIHVIDELSPATRVVESAPGSVPSPVTIFIQEAVVDGTLLTLTFSGGEAPCFVVDHAELVEEDDRVVAFVYAGQAADTQGVDCSTDEMSSQAVAIQLTAPLDGRALLDGSRLGGTDAS